jgi:hypothetical protein
MVAYIIQLAKEIVTAATAPCDVERMFTLIRVLPGELNRLDPRDFLPSTRFDFVLARASARQWRAATSFNFSEAVHALIIKQIAVIDRRERHAVFAAVEQCSFIIRPCEVEKPGDGVVLGFAQPQRNGL